MVTIIFFIAFLGFYVFYNTSKKADLNRSGKLELWVQNHLQYSKYIGSFLLIVTLVVSIIHFGVGSGIFAFFVTLMTVGSLIIVLSPLQYVTIRIVSVVFLLSLLLEII
ncbi:hypothetical protein AAG747_12810 [Rapidithrix thailandica]|uniref:DUF3325 domain-containing protein n=1 Tax=Rapidithrix thailandica TaxID=413964 RepID=A0AAW9S8X1_9BACT